MVNKKIYSAPEIEVVEFVVEAGFSLSGIGSGSDYGDGGEGSEME